MKTIIIVLGIAFVVAVSWHIGGSLSSDAMVLALGVIFGMMAGIPAALIAANRRPVHTHTTERITERIVERSAPQPVTLVQPHASQLPAPQRWHVVEDVKLIETKETVRR